MNDINWNTYLFHCSGLSNLMVKSRKAGELSETTKTYLRELWIKETWGREQIGMIGNKYTTKGIMCETDSIELLEKVTGEKYFKNNNELSNEWVVGTPDITKPYVVDIKTSWDLYTFASVDMKKALKDYYYQLLGYMWLTDEKNAALSYCLVDTPETLMADELYKISFKLPEDQVAKHERNFKFGDIPEKLRVKSYPIIRSDEDIESVKLAITSAREYLSTIIL